MKLATFRSPLTPDRTRVGRVDDDHSATLVGEFADVAELLQQPNWRELAAHASELTVEFEQHTLAPPIPRPGKIICVGLNYAAHIAEMGHERPDVPTLFIKFPEALIGPFDDIQVPSFAQDTADYEGELAVIVAKRTRNATPEEAADSIAGFSVINDFTCRELQKRTQQWHQGKSLERTSGFGPWLVTPDELDAEARLHTVVNGEERQNAPLSDLVFSPADLVSFCSQLYTLNPGDVIATGTPAGVGHGRGEYLSHNDVVQVSIDGIGRIRNRVVFGG
ncbi:MULTISPECIES: fumarylacetoacetate hydrolase family protein [unclassified Corynebacterium]|uniref:fumarylacetoacetate hydrolase family protein n=1 Tax=unclassified Corynebacterium TaxID=2624378 RepID=UPI001C4951B0|nr:MULTISPECIES: fumarylacetoacetate hydrolase family protein [unclassified Corynebacterium]MBV7281272.1 fumarylacetoacetate hydrolase family protein [Corynebacterium sp. TAE3-ERU30]MBV7301842.1 fumarylacetoacetate hydrolase family protein [Corynebacterium sp. TAE3-ERU2]